MLGDRIRKRRKELAKDINQLQDSRKDIIDKRNKVVKSLGNATPNITASASEYKSYDNEPFGWRKGTIRGMLTLWITLVFCIRVIQDRVPDNIFYAIATAIIMSYFVSRAMTYSQT